MNVQVSLGHLSARRGEDACRPEIDESPQYLVETQLGLLYPVLVHATADLNHPHCS
jgi:hypothetical protein